MAGFSPRGTVLRTFAWALVRSFVALGFLHLPAPHALEAMAELRRRQEEGAPPAPLARPPAGHPERLCPDLPLSPLERELDRDLLPSRSRRRGR
ncbi:DUF6059 family protein [Streptomyces sp. RP5T]|uniref:DUF6059 family protein n=1 Tax=Streptomyces sp. RP5T TaxID=2490848 RepID=UPI000F64A1D5|nr:DUF6059 family protein [Streptomyces sp. RP5T]RRR84997.1 hypothetical protein EHS43_09730 [Streptomyces sp. RP5T]